MLAQEFGEFDDRQESCYGEQGRRADQFGGAAGRDPVKFAEHGDDGRRRHRRHDAAEDDHVIRYAEQPQRGRHGKRHHDQADGVRQVNGRKLVKRRFL